MTGCERIDSSLRDRLARVPVSAITTILSSHGIIGAFMDGVRTIESSRRRMVGQAYTLLYVPSRPDLDTIESFSRPDAMQRLALEAVPAGDVLVIDARGFVGSACAGDPFVRRLQAKGCAGIVTDGGCATSTRSRRSTSRPT